MHRSYLHGLALTLTLAVSTSAQAFPTETPDPLWDLLLCRGELRDASQQDVVRELSKLGPEAAKDFMAILSGREASPDDGGPAPRWNQQELLLAAVGTMNSRAVIAELELSQLTERVDLVAAIQLLGATGQRDAIEPMIQLTCRLDPADMLSTMLGQTLRSAFDMILASEHRSTAAIGQALDDTEESLRPRVLLALGNTPPADGLLLFERYLGQASELDLAALKAFEHLDPRDRFEHARELGVVVRQLLGSEDRLVRRAAAASLIRYPDRDHVDPLISGLEDQDPGVRSLCLRALRELSDQRLDSDQLTWEAWHDRELAWYSERYDSLLSEVRSADPALIPAAMRELARHPLFGDESASLVAEVLWHEHDGLVILALEWLLACEYGAPLERVVNLLQHSSQEVQVSAHAALQTWTACRIDADYNLWRSWLAGSSR